MGYSAPIRQIAFNKIDSKIGLKNNEFDRCRCNTWTMCEFNDSNCNVLGDICWKYKLIYFSIICTLFMCGNIIPWFPSPILALLRTVSTLVLYQNFPAKYQLPIKANEIDIS